MNSAIRFETLAMFGEDAGDVNWLGDRWWCFIGQIRESTSVPP